MHHKPKDDLMILLQLAINRAKNNEGYYLNRGLPDEQFVLRKTILQNAYNRIQYLERLVLEKEGIKR